MRCEVRDAKRETQDASAVFISSIPHSAFRVPRPPSSELLTSPVKHIVQSNPPPINIHIP